MDKRDILILKEQIERKYKLGVMPLGNKLMVYVPNSLGLGDNHKDKIDYVEELMNNLVDDIRQYRKVFDLECHATYEFITIRFIE